MYNLAELCIIGLMFIGYIAVAFVMLMTIQFLVYQLTGFSIYKYFYKKMEELEYDK